MTVRINAVPFRRKVLADFSANRGPREASALARVSRSLHSKSSRSALCVMAMLIESPIENPLFESIYDARHDFLPHRIADTVRR